MPVFTGAAVAIVTPFGDDDDQRIDYDAFAELIDYQIANGTDAIVVAGSTGEASTMTKEEHLQACKFAVEYTKHRVPVIAGSGSNCTRTSAALSSEIAGYGADALLVVTPYYNKGTQEGLYLHYKAIAEAVHGTRIIIYNVPSRTGGNIAPSTVARLVKDFPNIVGIKEASGLISQVVRLMNATDGNIELYSGNDDQVVPLLSLGGKGVISVVSNVAPKIMHEMCADFFAGDIAGAAKLQRDIIPLYDDLFSEVSPIPVKKAVNLMGFHAGNPRMPLTPMSEEKAAKLEKTMRSMGLIS